MSLLLYFLASLILVHAVLLIVGLAHFQQISRQVPAVLAASLLISAMMLAMVFQRWDVLILSFIVYRCWTMIESLLLQGRITHSALALAPVNLITIGGSLAAFFSGMWMIFGATYLFHWTITLVVGKRLVANQHS